MSSIDLQNNKIRQMLCSSIKSGRVSHAYLFAGGTENERTETGRWYAQALLCDSEDIPCGKCLSCRKFQHGNHEDFISIAKEKDRETISVEQISGLIDRLSLKPLGKRYVVLINNADLMNAAAQNKLLKTLEEPVSETVIILLVDKDGSMLPTVLSRCVKFYLNSDGSEVPDDIRRAAESFATAFINKAPYYIKKNIILPVISDKENSRVRALLFLDALEDALRTRLMSDSGTIPDMIRQTETSRKYIRQLHSVQWTLKQLCLR